VVVEELSAFAALFSSFGWVEEAVFVFLFVADISLLHCVCENGTEGRHIGINYSVFKGIIRSGAV